jgi:hypothetical protein
VRPVSHHKREPGPAVRACICAKGGPAIVATFRNQSVVSIAVEHHGYCPMPLEPLNIGVYIATGKRVPR